MCRTLQYQKRLVANAKEAYEEECAVVIQKHYRRRLAQRRFTKLLKMRVPSGEKEKQEWCAARLTEMSDRLIERLEEEDCGIERLLADLDRKIFFSRSAREVAERSLREPAGGESGGDGAPSAASDPQAAPPAEEEKREVDWEGLKCTARKRKDKTCPICIGPLARKLRGNVALLSCSHMFHEDCIQLFELFQEAEQSKPMCPLCRAEYEKKVIQVTEL